MGTSIFPSVALYISSWTQKHHSLNYTTLSFDPSSIHTKNKTHISKANMFARLSLIALALAFFLNLTTALPHFGWYPRPTAAFPHPTGGFNPFPTGFPTGFPPGWVPGEAPAPTGI